MINESHVRARLAPFIDRQKGPKFMPRMQKIFYDGKHFTAGRATEVARINDAIVEPDFRPVLAPYIAATTGTRSGVPKVGAFPRVDWVFNAERPFCATLQAFALTEIISVCEDAAADWLKEVALIFFADDFMVKAWDGAGPESLHQSHLHEYAPPLNRPMADGGKFVVWLDVDKLKRAAEFIRNFVTVSAPLHVLFDPQRVQTPLYFTAGDPGEAIAEVATCQILHRGKVSRKGDPENEK